jgi:hypothetical protein
MLPSNGVGFVLGFTAGSVEDAGSLHRHKTFHSLVEAIESNAPNASNFFPCLEDHHIPLTCSPLVRVNCGLEYSEPRWSRTYDHNVFLSWNHI